SRASGLAPPEMSARLASLHRTRAECSGFSYTCPLPEPAVAPQSKCFEGATVLPHCQPHVYEGNRVTRYVRLRISDVDIRYRADEPWASWPDRGAGVCDECEAKNHFMTTRNA